MRLIALGLRWLFCGRSELIGSALAGFKSRFRTTDETVIATGEPGQAMIHVEVAILAGRAAETKTGWVS